MAETPPLKYHLSFVRVRITAFNSIGIPEALPHPTSATIDPAIKRTTSTTTTSSQQLTLSQSPSASFGKSRSEAVDTETTMYHSCIHRQDIFEEAERGSEWIYDIDDTAAHEEGQAILELPSMKVAFLLGEMPIVKVVVSTHWSTDVEEHHKSLLHHILLFFRNTQGVKCPPHSKTSSTASLCKYHLTNWRHIC